MAAPIRYPIHSPIRSPIRSPMAHKWEATSSTVTGPGGVGSPMGLLLVLTNAA